MKILFVWRKYHQTVGGVERMSIAIMNSMVKRGHEVFLLSWDQANATTYYDLDPRVKWHKLDSGDPDKVASWPLRFRRMTKIRRHVKAIKPDIILTFMDGIFLTIRLSILGLNIPVVEAERCSAARFQFLRTGRYVKLIFQSLRLASRITIQLESYRQDYPKYLQSRITVIPNPVFQSQLFAHPFGTNNSNKILLAVGRLSFQKNFSVLIEAFSKVAHDFPDWTLRIAGDGEERMQLESLAERLGIASQVDFIGFTKDVKSLYLSSHLFCLPSRWEGFPNALAEALSYGLPSIGFQGCLGVRDLIQHGKNGLLASGTHDSETLSDALRLLMKDDNLRKVMGAEAVASMLPYAPESIFDSWEVFFKDAVKNPQPAIHQPRITVH